MAFAAGVSYALVADARSIKPDRDPADAPPDPGPDPVVAEHINMYFQYAYYAPHPDRYWFLLDPEAGAV